MNKEAIGIKRIWLGKYCRHAEGGGMGGHRGNDDEDDEPLYQLETLLEPQLKQSAFWIKHLLNRSYVPIS